MIISIESFLQSPASWLSVGALIISGVSLAVSIANRSTQAEQWREINRARIRAHGPKLRIFKTMDADHAKQFAWGYHPLCYSVPEDPSTVRIQSQLHLVDPDTRARAVIGHSPLFTFRDAQAELARHARTKLSVESVMEVVWGFQNDGNLPATDVIVSVERQQDDGTFSAFVAPKRWDDLKKSQEIYPQVTIAIPLDVLPPTNLVLRVTFNYKSLENQHREVFTARWEPVSNNWQLE